MPLFCVKGSFAGKSVELRIHSRLEDSQISQWIGQFHLLQNECDLILGNGVDNYMQGSEEEVDLIISKRVKMRVRKCILKK